MKNITWLGLLQKSKAANLQLEFVANVSLSYVFENKAYIEQLKCRELTADGDLILYLDARSRLYKRMSAQVQILWYFPLSREKYIFDAAIHRVDDAAQKDSYWLKVDKEERKSYHNVEPDHYYDKVAEKQLQDIDKFNSQEKEQLSENFAVVVCRPGQVEYCKEPGPQVIADSRTKFESLFKPYKKSERYLHEIVNGQWVARALSI